MLVNVEEAGKYVKIPLKDLKYESNPAIHGVNPDDLADCDKLLVKDISDFNFKPTDKHPDEIIQDCFESCDDSVMTALQLFQKGIRPKQLRQMLKKQEKHKITIDRTSKKVEFP